MPIAQRLLLVVASVLVVAGGVTAVDIQRNPVRSAEQTLNSAITFVEASKTVSFDGRLSVELGQSSGERGSGSVSRVKVVGVTEFGQRSMVRVDAGESFTEAITIGRRVFVREAETKGALAGEKYASFDPDEQASRQGIVGQPDQVVALGEPTNLPATLRSAKNPRIVSRDGSTSVVSAEFDPASGNQQIAEAVTRADVIVTVARNGQVRKARYVIKGDEISIDASYALTGWGARVEVAAPAASLIDPTPFVDEEKIAAFKDAPLFQPVGIPEGWALDGVDVAPADSTAEGCDQATIDYADPNDPENGYLYLFEFPVSCADDFSGVGVKPFSAGAYSGGIESGPDGTFAQITVGSTVIQADTDLSSEDLAVVLGTLRPFDLAVTPNPLPGIGKRRTAA